MEAMEIAICGDRSADFDAGSVRKYIEENKSGALICGLTKPEMPSLAEVGPGRASCAVKKRGNFK